MVVISHYDTRQVEVPATDLRQTQHRHRIFSVTDNCRLVGEIIDLPPVKRRIRTMRLLDGWLLLSSTSETLTVPMPAE